MGRVWGWGDGIVAFSSFRFKARLRERWGSGDEIWLGNWNGQMEEIVVGYGVLIKIGYVDL